VKTDISGLILRTATQTNEQLAKRIEQSGAETVLLGEGGVVDSLGLVTLIVAVEGAIEDELDISVTLADERALSQETSPFLTVGTLEGYIAMLLDDLDDV